MSESYVVDLHPPTGTVLIGGGAVATNALSVPLGLHATDDPGPVVRMRFRENDLPWTPWESYAESRLWMLAAGDGGKTVSVQFQDAVGNVSATASGTIVLDTVSPTVELSSPEPGFLSDHTPSLYFCVDEGAVRVLVDGIEVSKSPGDTIGPLEDGIHRVRVEAYDAAGNSGFDEVTVTVDTTPPVVQPLDDVFAEASGELTPVDTAQPAVTDALDPHPAVWSNAPATYPLGSTLVTWTAADAGGNSATAVQIVTVADSTPPVLTIPDDIAVHATAVLTPVDIGSAVATDVFPVTLTRDAPSNGIYPVGTTLVTWNALDANGNRTLGTQRITVLPREVRLVYTGDSGVQWSDTATLSAQLHDVTGGRQPAPLAGIGAVTLQFLQDGVIRYEYDLATPNPAGRVSIAHTFADGTLPADPGTDYAVRLHFSDPLGIYAAVALEQPFELLPEQGAAEYTGEQVVTINDTSVTFQATFYQEMAEANGHPIDFAGDWEGVWAQFLTYKFGQDPSVPGTLPQWSSSPVRVAPSLLHPGVGVAVMTIPLTELGTGQGGRPVEENYVVVARLTDQFYLESVPDEATLTVYDPLGLFFAGGGFILDGVSGRHNNFGFTFKFNKKGNPQGNVVYVIRDDSTGTKTRVKSNALEAAGFPPDTSGALPGDLHWVPTALAEGKCNVVSYDLVTDEWVDGVGNLSFRVRVEDRGPYGIGEDTFRVEVHYPDGVPYEAGNMGQAEVIEGGNIVIRAEQE